MGIKICGHKIRWQKPIKVFNLFKASCLVLMVCIISIPPATAKDFKQQKASTGATATCGPLQDTCMTAPKKENPPQHRIQRNAGQNTVSPALALAMALGVRNVQGPVERRQPAAVRAVKPRMDAKQTMLSQTGETSKRLSSNAAGIRFVLEN